MRLSHPRPVSVLQPPPTLCGLLIRVRGTSAGCSTSGSSVRGTHLHISHAAA